MPEAKPGFVSIDELENKIYSVLAREYERSSGKRTPWLTEVMILWTLGYDGTSPEVNVALGFLIRKGLVERAQAKNVSQPAYLYKILTPNEIAERKLAKDLKA